MAKAASEKLAIGIYNEGQTLYVVKLSKSKDIIKLLEAQVVELPVSLDLTEVESTAASPATPTESTEISSIDITQDTASLEISAPTSEMVAPSDNTSILSNLFAGYTPNKAKMAISIAEPYIYYATFNTNWNLSGKKLESKVIEELTKQKAGEKPIIPEELSVIELPNGRLMAIVRDRDVGLIRIVGNIKRSNASRFPAIAFVESLEVSLINLVKANYKLEENQVTLIIYIGSEFSRLIFLQGKDILYISQLIGDGYNTPNIANILYSRLLFEHDNLNLPKVDNIILTGKSHSADIKGALVTTFFAEGDVDLLKYNNLNTWAIDPSVLEILPEFAVPLGAAWRSLDSENKDLFDVDLLPTAIRAGQKVLQLGLVGWLLLMIIPILVLFFTIKTSQNAQLIKGIDIELNSKQVNLIQYNDLQSAIDQSMNELNAYRASFSLLDTITVGVKTWSEFLTNVMNQSAKVGEIWFSEVTATKDKEAQLIGYSLYRNRIFKFANALEGASLESVEMMKIRERTVYKFTINVKVPVK
jgi:hypothetical protein